MSATTTVCMKCGGAILHKDARQLSIGSACKDEAACAKRRAALRERLAP